MQETGYSSTSQGALGDNMAKNITDAVREICLSFPESEAVISHGSPDYRVHGKTFATYVINHHGDGHLALWLRVADLVREAYVEVAPKRFTANLGPAIEIEPPTETIDAEIFDPFCAPAAADKLTRIGQLCLALPETQAGRQFGDPCFRAGKKNFCTLYFRQGRMRLSVWVGKPAQATLTFDDRYSVPAYTGHNGWIELDIQEDLLIEEAQALILDSYKHFALQRMLKKLHMPDKLGES